MKKIATYTMNEEFVPEKIGIVSLAAKSLCMWVIAIEKYAKVWKYAGISFELVCLVSDAFFSGSWRRRKQNWTKQWNL